VVGVGDEFLALGREKEERRRQKAWSRHLTPTLSPVEAERESGKRHLAQPVADKRLVEGFHG